jgi:hypothetical protein
MYKWQFVFLGANMDAIDEGSQIGVAAASAMNYNPNQPKGASQSPHANWLDCEPDKTGQ